MIDIENKPKKCYNKLSCILSVAIILFVTLSIAWQNFVTNPRTYRSIENLRTEVRLIKEIIDTAYSVKSSYMPELIEEDGLKDSMFVDENE